MFSWSAAFGNNTLACVSSVLLVREIVQIIYVMVELCHELTAGTQVFCRHGSSSGVAEQAAVVGPA